MIAYGSKATVIALSCVTYINVCECCSQFAFTPALFLIWKDWLVQWLFEMLNIIFQQYNQHYIYIWNNPTINIDRIFKFHNKNRGLRTIFYTKRDTIKTFSIYLACCKHWYVYSIVGWGGEMKLMELMDCFNNRKQSWLKFRTFIAEITMNFLDENNYTEAHEIRN